MNLGKLLAAVAGLLVIGCSGNSQPVDAGTDAAVSDASTIDGGADGPKETGPFCGDGKRDLGELCDGTDLGGATCADMVAAGWNGTLGCNAQCVFDTTTCTTPATTYSALNASWDTFDVASVTAAAHGYAGGVFDGRYVYLVPHDNGQGLHGLVARYDSQAPFGSASAWTTFDVASVNAKAMGFAHGAFDGRYLYLTPSGNGYLGTIARYDTQAAFDNANSWSTLDLATLAPTAHGFGAIAFDGQYIYLIQERDGTQLYPPGGLVARFDTSGPFTSAGSWSFFDVTTVSQYAGYFFGSAFDGRFLYLVPDSGGAIARYDTHAAFGAASSWSTFTTSAFSTRFFGGAFDGRYVYFVPSYDAQGAGLGVIARYDTTGTFTSSTAWSTFDVSTVNASAKGYRGAVFDGRYLFFVPYYNAPNYHGFVARYDTQAPFSNGSSWNVFDLTSVNAAAIGFNGGVFDGEHVYLVPDADGASGTVARFDAKTPAWLPKGWNASFF